MNRKKRTKYCQRKSQESNNKLKSKIIQKRGSSNFIINQIQGDKTDQCGKIRQEDNSKPAPVEIDHNHFARMRKGEIENQEHLNSIYWNQAHQDVNQSKFNSRGVYRPQFKRKNSRARSASVGDAPNQNMRSYNNKIKKVERCFSSSVEKRLDPDSSEEVKLFPSDISSHPELKKINKDTTKETALDRTYHINTPKNEPFNIILENGEILQIYGDHVCTQIPSKITHEGKVQTIWPKGPTKIYIEPLEDTPMMIFPDNIHVSPYFSQSFPAPAMNVPNYQPRSAVPQPQVNFGQIQEQKMNYEQALASLLTNFCNCKQ